MENARPGDQFQYFKGSHLPGERALSNLREIRKAYDDGLIDLVQRRVSKDNFAYVAIRRNHHAKIPDSFRFASRQLYA